MRIGSGLILPKTAALAPMAGVGDRAFREICRELGACYTVGEMASAKGIAYRNEKSAELLASGELDRPFAAQIFGDEPATMAAAAQFALRYSPDVIDINMGCPAPKIAGNGGGCALMKNLPLAGDIIRAVVGAVDIPVTVKLRKGWDDTQVNAVELARIAEAAGAAAVAVHGRTREQMYAPPVDLDIIRQVKRAVSIPVIGNGGIADIESAVKMYEATGCDLIMVGQGALGAPWLFLQLHSYFSSGVTLPEPSLAEKMAIMRQHVELACSYKGERVGMRESRKHIAWYMRGLAGAASLRRAAGGLTELSELDGFIALVVDRARQSAEGSNN